MSIYLYCRLMLFRILSIYFIFSLCALIASARDFTYSGAGTTIIYTVIDEDAKTCRTKDCFGYNNNCVLYAYGDVTLPANPSDGKNTYTLVEIGRKGFTGHSWITSVSIPSTVTTIGAEAFSYCSRLSDVSFDNVQTIGKESFRGCNMIRSFNIPASVREIGVNAFADCQQLEKFDAADANEHFATFGGVLFDKTFSTLIRYPIKAESNYSIPATVTRIADYAFYNCTGLASAELPDALVSIGNFAFYGCNSLTSVCLSNATKEIGISAFERCTALRSIKFGERTEYVGDGAFAYCSDLRDIVIPATVNEISPQTFAFCDRLETVTLVDGIGSIGRQAFIGCKSLAGIDLPNSVNAIDDGAFMQCASLKNVKIGSGIVLLANDAFTGCTALESIDVCADNPDFASFRGAVFDKEMTHLLMCPEGRGGYFVVPSGVEEISDKAFYNCSNLKSVSFPVSLKVIGEWSFYNCRMLSEITIPENVAEIGWGAFDACSSLLNVSCASLTPPHISNSTFAQPTLDNATLHVPTQAAEAYSNHEYWGAFATITKDEFNSLTDITSDPASSGIDLSLPYQIITLQGTSAGSDIRGLSPGFYIIRQGRISCKIAVKAD